LSAGSKEGAGAPQCAEDQRGLVFNIQKFSLHDGSGIRTLVFLKGCPLRCRWCANPEGQATHPELAFNSDRCIGTTECGRCIEVCGEGAIEPSGDGKVRVDRALCNNCGDCIAACPSRALELFGTYMSVDEMVAVVEEDSAFYARSGGGLTLSGGEPLVQAEFAIALLKRAQERGIDTALETSGHCRWDDLERACAHVSQLFFDIKSLNLEKHGREVGIGGKTILRNLRRLVERLPGLPIVVRTPVIPGFNDSDEEIAAIANLVGQLPGELGYELLPYHGFGGPKYLQLGMPYDLEELSPPSPQQMDRLLRIAEAARVPDEETPRE
jgi:pyruvate formate lyase activating enzyme